MNYLLDVNIILDVYNEERSEKFPESVKVFNHALEGSDFFISSSSLDNIAYLLANYMRKEYGYTLKQRKFLASRVVKHLVENIKIAKTPSYIEIDYEDIEDAQIIASAQAVDAKVITRDEKMLEKYPTLTISVQEFIEKVEGGRKKEEGNAEKNNPSTFNLQPSTLTIDFANLKKQYFLYQPELEKEMDKVLNNASYIMGDAVRELEQNLQNFTKAKHAVTCSSGTDALLLAMMALDIQPGDEIITTPFTFIATAETIALLGAKPVFVDIDEKTYNIDPSKIAEKITPKTKAIMPVSLYGQPADLDAINQFKIQNSKLKIIIDGAQSFGATYKGKAEVHHCDIYTTSFFPAKPLGCFGDGGAVLTNDDTLAEKMKMLRVHGQNKRYHHKYIGLGARLDTIQAAILNVKLKHYPKDLKRRQEVADKYNDQFKTQNSKFKIVLPQVKSNTSSAWAQYSIRVKNRNEIQAHLKEKGIPTAVHYPMPLHLQECFSYLGHQKGDFPIAEKVSEEIMSLPMNPYLRDEEIEYICRNLL